MMKWLTSTLSILFIAAQAITPVNAGTYGGTLIDTQSTATYFDPGVGEVFTVISNHAYARVAEVASVSITKNQSFLAAPGQTISIPHVVRNTGNIDDSYILFVSQKREIQAI